MVLNLVEAQAYGKDLEVGSILQAKRWNPNSIGGVAGPKYRAITNGVELFIVGKYRRSDQLAEEAQYSAIIDGDKAFAPRFLIERLMTTVLFQELAKKLESLDADTLPKVTISTLNPVALAHLSTPEDSWQNDAVSLRLSEVLDKKFWDGGRKSVESVSRQLTSSQMDASDKKLATGEAYPFIPDFKQQDLGTFAEGRPIEDQLALCLTFLKINKTLAECGLRWRDQGKGPDNYLATVGDAGQLKLILADYDLAIMDRRLYRSSFLYWKAFDELIIRNDSPSDFNTHNLLKQLAFKDSHLYQALRASVVGLHEAEAIDSLIMTLEGLAIGISGQSETAKLELIQRVIRKYLPPEETKELTGKSDGLEANTREVISRAEWRLIIDSFSRENVFGDFPRGIHQLDRGDVDFEIESKRTKQVISKMAMGEKTPIETLREIALNLSYCCTFKPGSNNPGAFFKALFYLALPGGLKNRHFLEIIEKYSGQVFAESSPNRSKFPEFVVSNDEIENEWYVEQINESIKKLFVKD